MLPTSQAPGEPGVRWQRGWCLDEATGSWGHPAGPHPCLSAVPSVGPPSGCQKTGPEGRPEPTAPLPGLSPALVPKKDFFHAKKSLCLPLNQSFPRSSL